MKHKSATLITRMLTEEDLPDKDEYIQTVCKVDVILESRALTIDELDEKLQENNVL